MYIICFTYISMIFFKDLILFKCMVKTLNYFKKLKIFVGIITVVIFAGALILLTYQCNIKSLK